MLGEERQQAILAAVEQRHSVSVQELMQLLDISESTIRRDLNALDKEGSGDRCGILDISRIMHF